MRAEWLPVWCPQRDSSSMHYALCNPAIAANLPPVVCLVRPLSDFDGFLAATVVGRGAAGLDGWSCSELRPLASNSPWFVLSGFSFWQRSSLTDQFVGHIVIWRIAGIGKRDSDEARPIAVASVAVRAWHWAQLRFAPPLPARQFVGKRGVSVRAAVASWLAASGDAGSEADLRRAFDSVVHGVARVALEWLGVDDSSVGTVIQGWVLARFCCTSSTLAEQIYATSVYLPATLGLSGCWELCWLLGTPPWSSFLASWSGPSESKEGGWDPPFQS